MAWEKQRYGQRAYTRSKRVAGKIVREYVGKGDAAEEAAEADKRDRAAAAQERKEQKQRWAEWDEVDAKVAALYKQIEELARQAYEQAGYHQHARGQWRKKHGTQQPKGN